MNVVPRTPKIEHGKRTTYVRGCRCDACKQANTEYGQNLKKRRRTGQRIQPPLASVTTIRQQESAVATIERDPDEPGRVELAVLKEVQSLSASSRHAGLVESIMTMAKILDNPEAITTHPSAHRQLTLGLDKLHEESVGRKGMLADVAAMTVRNPPKATKGAKKDA